METIIKFVGTEAAKIALKEFSSPHIDQLKKLLLGEGENKVKTYLEKLDGQMREVALEPEGR